VWHLRRRIFHRPDFALKIYGKADLNKDSGKLFINEDTPLPIEKRLVVMYNYLRVRYTTTLSRERVTHLT
jgi:hypothetical protein